MTVQVVFKILFLRYVLCAEHQQPIDSIEQQPLKSTRLCNLHNVLYGTIDLFHTCSNEMIPF